MMISTIEKNKRPKLIMNKAYLCTNIKFDTDGEPVGNLPKKMELIVDTSAFPNDEEAFECRLQEELGDLISDLTGWCVDSFKYTQVG